MNDPHDPPSGKGNGRPAEEEDAATRPPEAERPEDANETGVALVEEPPPTRAELEALRQENAELRDQLLRRRADFENYRRRVERERAAAGQEALVALLKDLVTSLDNLERALAAPGDGAAVREGVALIQRTLLTTLGGHGLRVDDPLGRPFDPEIHQALSYDDAPGQADGTVLRVLGKGYFHKDRLLRPALVQVARGGPPARVEDAPQAPADGQVDGEGGAQAPPGDTSGTDELH